MILDHAYSFKTLDATLRENNAEAVAFLERFPLPENAWLTGKNGRGKTHLAMCAHNRHCWHWMQRAKQTGEILQSGELGQRLHGMQLRNIANQLPDDVEADVSRYGRCRLLVLDDIDKVELVNLKPLETLLAILDLRYRRGLLTIATSNFSGASLRALWEKCCSKNPTLPASIIDRMQPCRGLEIHGPASLRSTHAPLRTEATSPSVNNTECVSKDVADVVRRMNPASIVLLGPQD